MTLPPKKAEDIPRASVAVGGIYDFTAASYRKLGHSLQEIKEAASEIGNGV